MADRIAGRTTRRMNRAVHALLVIAAASVIGGYLFIGWTGSKRPDQCNGGVGPGCTVDTRVELVHGTDPCDPCVEWREYDGTYWRRYTGSQQKFEETPGAVLVGGMP